MRLCFTASSGTCFVVNVISDRGNLENRIDPGNHFKSGVYSTNMENRDFLLTNIGIAEIFSVRHGVYPGEKCFPSYANCLGREGEQS